MLEKGIGDAGTTIAVEWEQNSIEQLSKMSDKHRLTSCGGRARKHWG